LFFKSVINTALRRVLIFHLAVVVWTEKEEILAVEHPPEFILFKDCENYYFGPGFVVDWRLIQNQKDSDCVVACFEEPEEQVVDNPVTYWNTTVGVVN